MESTEELLMNKDTKTRGKSPTVIVPFKEIHVKTIKTRFGAHPQIKDTVTIDFVESELSWSVLNEDGEVLAIFGGVSQGRVVVSWLVLSRQFIKYAEEVTTAINEMIENLSERGTHDYILGTVPVTSTIGQEWITQKLGFTPLDQILELDGEYNHLYERRF